MDKLELTEENLKKVFIEEYARAVSLRQDCEADYRTLNPDNICVFIDDKETTVKFPCPQAASCAYWCASQAAKETSRRFFGDNEPNFCDTFMVISGVPPEQFNLETTIGYFEWRHRP